MTKTSSVTYLRERLDQEWPPFRELVGSVAPDEMIVPGVVDEWCLKELLGHVNFWARKGAHDVRAAASGQVDSIEVPGGDAMVDEWNATAAASGLKLATDAVLPELEASHADARNALHDTTDEALAIELKGWTVGVRFAEDTYRHYREHADQIRSWKQGLETTEE
jgi:hypothetical protein